MSSEQRVRVAVRVRPLLATEADHACSLIAANARKGTVTTKESSNDVASSRSFQFDTVVEPEVSQEDFYDMCGLRDMVGAALQGVNISVMAYGQTGSGKTYTMEGTVDEFGIVPRIIAGTFSELDMRQERGIVANYEGQVSFLQLYNERVLDLLSLSDGKVRGAGVQVGSMGGGLGYQTGLALRYDGAKDSFYAEGLTTPPVRTALEAMHYFHQGIAKRVVAAHAMNAASSRSHCVFTLDLKITLQGKDGRAGQVVTTRIALVDLAGSERASKTHAAGAVLEESISINKSLFVLRQVIKALAENTQGIEKAPPYRDSKLTSLLKNSLGGNSSTLMVACITPSDSYVEEATSTLSYAAHASQIVNVTRVNDVPDAASFAALRDEIASLKSELQSRSTSQHESTFKTDFLRSSLTSDGPGENVDKWKQKVVDVVGLLRQVAASHSELKAKHKAKQLECNELASELEAQRSENANLHEKLEMMQYLLPVAGSPHRNSDYHYETAKSRTFSESRVPKTKLQNPLPPLSSSIKAAIPSIDKSNRLPGVRRERRSADDAADFTHGSMEPRQLKTTPVRNPVVSQRPSPPMATSEHIERNLAGNKSTARFPKRYTTPVDGPALFSASDLMSLLKGGDKSGSGASC